MVVRFRKNPLLLVLWMLTILFAAGCGEEQITPTPTVEPTATLEPTATPTITPEPTATPTPVPDIPGITSVSLDRAELPKYESLEMMVDVTAEYDNPYDAGEVTLDATFTGPDDTEMTVPGFWDGEESWRVRFTPSVAGEWQYQLIMTDTRGAGQPATGSFTVTESDLHGWLLAGNLVNADYSGHYLVYHDGTPFYGIGHVEALNILIDGFNIEDGVGLFDDMKAANENYVIWWPLYTNSPLVNSYDNYMVSNLNLIDLVVQDAQQEGIFLIFTIWDHPQLRDENHVWDTGRWRTNGFNKLGDLSSFFVSDEAWRWQENFYRYIIARWGYSPAIGMWQTVSEINGTSAYEQTDAWHARVNTYFVQHDPYRHPTTASMSGNLDWGAGHLEMDAPQVHLYDFNNEAGNIDAVEAATVLAEWTTLMWNRAEKPNWVGEFGVTGNSYYPELFHNAIWAALGAGAAMTPAEWNSGGAWMRMSEEMNADISRLQKFVVDCPLAAWNPSPLQIMANDEGIRGWGVAGDAGGLFWIQDFTLAGQPMEEIRANETVRTGIQVDIEGLAAGTYTIQPYDTWQGITLDAFEVTCTEEELCAIVLPDFRADMAFKIERK